MSIACSSQKPSAYRKHKKQDFVTSYSYHTKTRKSNKKRKEIPEKVKSEELAKVKTTTKVKTIRPIKFNLQNKSNYTKLTASVDSKYDLTVYKKGIFISKSYSNNKSTIIPKANSLNSQLSNLQDEDSSYKSKASLLLLILSYALIGLSLSIFIAGWVRLSAGAIPALFGLITSQIGYLYFIHDNRPSKNKIDKSQKELSKKIKQKKTETILSFLLGLTFILIGVGPGLQIWLFPGFSFIALSLILYLSIRREFNKSIKINSEIFSFQIIKWLYILAIVASIFFSTFGILWLFVSI